MNNRVVSSSRFLVCFLLTGTLYAAEITADLADFLDFDKPFAHDLPILGVGLSDSSAASDAASLLSDADCFSCQDNSVITSVITAAEEFIESALQRADALMDFEPDLSADMKRFYRRFSTPGTPRLIKVGKKPAAWEVPLFDADFTCGGPLFLGAGSLNVLAVPLRMLPSGREEAPGAYSSHGQEKREGEALLPAKTAEAFREGPLPPVELAEAFFDMPCDKVTVPPDYLECIDEGYNQRMLGLPIDPEWPEVRMIEGYRLTSRNMHETEEAIERVNKLWAPDPPWKPLPGIRATPYKCLFYAVSYAAEWLADRAGIEVGVYKSIYHGGEESGVDPRMLEALYEMEASKNPDEYPFGPPLLFSDIVTGTRLAFGLGPLIKRLGRELDDWVEDHQLTGLVHPVPRWLDGLFSRYRKIETTEAAISEAIEQDCLVLAGLTHRYLGVPLYVPTHFVPVMGYFDLEGERYFVFREPYGDYPHYAPEDDRGGPAWRGFTVGNIGESWVICPEGREK